MTVLRVHWTRRTINGNVLLKWWEIYDCEGEIKRYLELDDLLQHIGVLLFSDDFKELCLLCNLLQRIKTFGLRTVE